MRMLLGIGCALLEISETIQCIERG
ncbi:protein of unknown function [Nitrospira japonica]|uniref:Uncharacterized protein n=1 Tax=Nitrospira japonica TaxID=1325564 RepID=A0A1W1I239_9BACT|nr:protein of unknown function [Nitrospira japonica]